MNLSDHINQIFSIQTEEEFEQLAIETFQYQYENVPVYREYCELLKINHPQSIYEIPFLPIDFFKSHEVRAYQNDVKIIFKSSGTTQGRRSVHFLENTTLYEQSFEKSYRKFVGHPENQIIIALLPNYVEQKFSSLVYMVDYLIQQTNHSLSGFYLNDFNEIKVTYQKAIALGKEPVLFGVTYALLDLMEEGYQFPGMKVIETGGMKGRRQEISKEQLHQILKENLKLNEIYSEYGMCELLSQAYSTGLEFETPSWMKVLIRDKNDPFSYVNEPKQGGINVIDLANLFSCSFIQTQDMGRIVGDKFQVNGRLDQSEIRGCNLMIDELG